MFAYASQAVSSKQASIVIDLNTNKVLHAHNEKSYRYPASLVKMMTLYIAFENLKKGKLTLNQKLLVSKKAAAMPRLNLNLKAGSKISVKEAILSLIVHSANDAAVVLAEAIAGNEASFAIIMNKKALELKMYKTKFQNASGWHNKNQKSTAYDLALLAAALKKNFPRFFPWFSFKAVSVNGVVYRSHNHVMRLYEWATGMKTGFTGPAGFNLATTASKEGKEIVAVVLGEASTKARDKYMIKLLDNGFQQAKANATIRTVSLKKIN